MNREELRKSYRDNRNLWELAVEEGDRLIIDVLNRIIPEQESHLSTLDRIDQLEAEKNIDKERLQVAEELLRDALNILEDQFGNSLSTVVEIKSFLAEVEG